MKAKCTKMPGTASSHESRELSREDYWPLTAAVAFVTQALQVPDACKRQPSHMHAMKYSNFMLLQFTKMHQRKGQTSWTLDSHRAHPLASDEQKSWYLLQWLLPDHLETGVEGTLVCVKQLELQRCCLLQLKCSPPTREYLRDGSQ